jgi:hypothetical protein
VETAEQGWVAEGSQQGTDSLGDLPQPFSDVEEHARATLTILREQFAFERWMITRLDADRLVVEFVEPAAGELTPGTSFPWSHTICARMVEGQGPYVAPSVAAVPAYAAAPLSRQLGVGAYAGAPIYNREGSLWGTVCALHPTALSPETRIDESYLHWIARSLATHLVSTVLPASPRQRPRRPGPSTILNSNMWSTLLAKEQERCARTGQTACVIDFDVTPALAGRADVDAIALADDAADLVATSARGCDFVGRTSATRVRLLAVDCSAESASCVMDRLLADLAGSGIAARAVVDDVLPHAPVRATATVEPPLTITYIACGHCDRRGAYVSGRFPVLRCKYCGFRHPLSDPEWRGALRNTPGVGR